MGRLNIKEPVLERFFYVGSDFFCIQSDYVFRFALEADIKQFTDYIDFEVEEYPDMHGRTQRLVDVRSRGMDVNPGITMECFVTMYDGRFTVFSVKDRHHPDGDVAEISERDFYEAVFVNKGQ